MKGIKIGKKSHIVERKVRTSLLHLVMAMMIGSLRGQLVNLITPSMPVTMKSSMTAASSANFINDGDFSTSFE